MHTSKSAQRPESFHKVISAVPAFALASMLETASPKASKILNQIEYINIAVVSLLYDHNFLSNNSGFGYLVAPSQNRPIMGVSYDSNTLPSLAPGPNHTRIAVMIGGDLTNGCPDVVKLSEQELKDIAIQTIKEDLGVSSLPIHATVSLCRNCIPQYHVGHIEKVKFITNQLELDMPNLLITGSAFHGISFQQCIENGFLVAKTALQQLKVL